MVAAVVEPERLVFVDEMRDAYLLGPIYGYAPRASGCAFRCPEAGQEHDGAL